MSKIIASVMVACLEEVVIFGVVAVPLSCHALNIIVFLVWCLMSPRVTFDTGPVVWGCMYDGDKVVISVVVETMSCSRRAGCKIARLLTDTFSEASFSIVLEPGCVAITSSRSSVSELSIRKKDTGTHI